MKSRIPYPQYADGEEKRPQGSHGDSSTVHAALNVLGAPHLDTEEFHRLYCGSLADALLFVSEHMKGRKGVALVRADLHQQREMRSKSHLKQPHGATRSAAEKAFSSLSGVRQTAEIYRKQMDDRQAGLAKSQARIDELKEKLRQLEQVDLLLDILEQKERLRMRRFQEMTRMLGELRKAVGEVRLRPQPSEAVLKAREVANTPIPLRIFHTRDVLSNLHAYHIRLSRILKPPHGFSEMMETLRKNVALQTGMSRIDPETERIVNQCISVARRRAVQIIGYQNRGLDTHPRIFKADLESKSKEIKAKEQELQRISDLSLALGFLCEHFISSMSVFLERTSHVLRLSLEEEVSSAKGYVDVLRCLIASSPSGNSDRKTFSQDAMDICKIRSRTPNAINDRVEELVTHAHRQRLFLESSATPDLPPLTPEQESLVATYTSDARSAEERAIKLLTRKVEKADLGDSLVKDIEVLLQETRIIVG